MQLKQSGETTGTEIAYQILDILEKEKQQPIDFKNVQRRVYDALNVFSALNIVQKIKNKISLSSSCNPDEEDKEVKTNEVGVCKERIVENTTKVCDELNTLKKKIALKKQEIQNKKSEYKEKIYQMLLLKKLMVRNCEQQNILSDDIKIVKVPFTVCSLQENSEYLVQVSEDRKQVLIYSEIAPTFYNDNHVMKLMELISENCEDEMRNLLPENIYKNARLAFDDKILRKTISKVSNSKNKQDDKELRKARKRNYKESLLVCDEQILKGSEEYRDENKSSSIRKIDKINKNNFELFRENIDCKSITSKQSEGNLRDISKNFNWGTPGNNKRLKNEIMFMNSRKNLLFDSIENKSAYEMSCSDERIHPEHDSIMKISPDKILNHNIESEDISHSPIPEHIRDYNLPNYKNITSKASMHSYLKNIPQLNDIAKSFFKNTPK